MVKLIGEAERGIVRLGGVQNTFPEPFGLSWATVELLHAEAEPAENGGQGQRADAVCI
jgi:hypothetical protein